MGIVVTDWNMPRMGGLELVKRLRADPAWAAVRVLVVSVSHGPEDTAAALQAGADACLSKPFSAVGLRRAVQQLLEPDTRAA